jgi:hypothetical protein
MKMNLAGELIFAQGSLTPRRVRPRRSMKSFQD